MATAITVSIDLDSKEYKQELIYLEENAENSGKKIGESLNSPVKKETIDSLGKLSKTISSVGDSATNVAASFYEVAKSSAYFSAIGASALLLGNSFTPIIKNLKDLGQVSQNIGSTLVGSKGIFGLTTTLSVISASLYAVSLAIKDVDNEFVRFTSSGIKLLSIAFGGMAAAIGITIIKISELATEIGTKLVSIFQAASSKFLEFNSSTEIFIASLDSMNRATGQLAGTNQEWAETIGNTSESLNISTKSLEKASQEIVLVGTQLGLTSDQMQKLLNVSAEYAKVNQKDVFDTTVAITSALNGNSQAVQALGIKLTQASVQQYAFTQGITDNIEKMSEGELVQLRFSKLLKQYGEIAGVGAVAANSLGDQQNRLTIATEKLSSSLGAGARFIEDNNILYFALNKVLNIFSDNTLKTAGFLGALGARFIQASGIILGVSFKFYALIKAAKLLDIALSSKFGETFFTFQIPIINKNLDTLASRALGTSTRIRSLNDVVKASTSGVRLLADSFSQFFFSSSLKNLTALGALRGAFSNISSVLARIGQIITPLIVPFAKFALIGGLVVGAFNLLKNAFEAVEKRTSAFTDLFSILLDEFRDAKSFFSPVVEFFNGFTESIKRLAMQGFGLLVFSIAKVVDAAVSLAQANPFGAFSKKTIARLSEVQGKLKGFTENLKSVAFDIGQIPEDASRAIAGSAGKATINLEQLVQKLNQIREQTRDVGMTDKEIILRDQEDALETLSLSFQNKLLAEREYLDLRNRVNLDAGIKLKELEDKLNRERIQKMDQVNKIINNSLANAISQGIQRTVQALAKGKSVFEGFGSWLIQLFGDLAIQLGQFYIADGIAKLALLKASPAAQITAGASLIALGSIMKSFFAGGLGGGSSVAAVGAEPGPGQFTTPNDLANPQDVEERQAPSTNVSIQVQGSLVQQEELGEFITRTLNESFGKQGVSLVDARFA